MQYSLVPKVYQAEIILLFWFLAYFLIHICGVNVTLEVVGHRSRPGKSPCAVDGANREVALCTRKMMYKKRMCPQGEEAKGSTSFRWSECLCTFCCKAAQLQPRWWQGITATSLCLCCLLRSVGNVNLIPAGLRPAHCRGWSGHPWAVAEPGPCPYPGSAVLAGRCGTSPCGEGHCPCPHHHPWPPSRLPSPHRCLTLRRGISI